MPLVVEKVTLVVVSVRPEVLALAVEAVVTEGACVNLAVLVAVCALAVFGEVDELALVALLALDQDAETLDFVGFPFADV